MDVCTKQNEQNNTNTKKKRTQSMCVLLATGVHRC